MSWREVTGSGVPRIAESPLDSARFGRPVERLTVPAGAGSPFPAVREAVLGSRADVVVLRYPAEHVGWFAELTALGRTAVFADSLAYWRLRAGRGRAPEPPGDLQPTQRVTPAAVRESISDIFAAYRNHYVANPLFGTAEALAGYREWALRSASEGGCVALLKWNPPARSGSDSSSAPGPDSGSRSDSAPDPDSGYGSAAPLETLSRTAPAEELPSAAFSPATSPEGGPHPATAGDGILALATLADDDERTEILLAGVASRARGRGLYAHLLAAVEGRALARGAREVVISTQGHNTGVQRAWARYGFEPALTFLTVHLVRSRLLRGRRR
ncbi:GNAT family N-acetyltransferase [Streptosporangium sp. NPDC002524]|uniref:GNAT family N-acetyltransferase n=1 Tax=Streptosporangium sp. NPDC002524 TaxID=3154537 RepID=UPI00331DA75E